MPGSLFIDESSRASPEALHPRRLPVGAPIASSVWLKTGAFEVIQLQYCTIASFVIYAVLKSILEPINRQPNQTTYFQQNKVYATAAILCSTLGNYN